jgi:sulfatase maturation enzyme AslB (radical SAM superfamily)
MNDIQSDDIQSVDLTQAASDICKTYYAKKCGECPLRPACCSHRDLDGVDKLNRWCADVNELAERFKPPE